MKALALTMEKEVSPYMMGPVSSLEKLKKELPAHAKNGTWVVLRNVHLDDTFLKDFDW